MTAITKENYRAFPAVNMSLLKGILSGGSLAHAEAGPKASWEVLNFGTQFHTALLEPHLFEPKIMDYNLRTKEGRENFARDKLNNVQLLKEPELEAIMAMVGEVRTHSEVCDLLDHPEAEVETPLLFRDSRTKTLMKSQIDLYTKDPSGKCWLIDLKTTRSVANFSRDFFKMNYDLQLAGYRRALLENDKPVDVCAILAAEKDSPYAAQLFIAGEDVLYIGGEKVDEALDLYLEAKRSGDYRPPLVQQLEAPTWLVSKYQNKDVFK
jgi:hypothetical protein